MQLVKTLTFLILPISSVIGQCPSLDEVPIMTQDDFTCARTFVGEGSDSLEEACTGCFGEFQLSSC